ncbi:MAG: type III polyketide synthase, partial [Elusimicrobia bacterium]|nr:type III polyketide synthase [Elusimicrobiota bacterium]
MVPRIAAVAVAVPEHEAGQEDIESFARRLFGEALPGSARLAGIFRRGGVGSRRFCVPLDWFSENRDPREKNCLYIRHAEELSSEAVKSCLRQAGLAARDVDHLFFVSTTGMATPSIDARLIGSLGFRRDVKRTPIWGLGCAGGAAGLARAADHVR